VQAMQECLAVRRPGLLARVEAHTTGADCNLIFSINVG
jgi:hypothetical protein